MDATMQVFLARSTGNCMFRVIVYLLCKFIFKILRLAVVVENKVLKNASDYLLGFYYYILILILKAKAMNNSQINYEINYTGTNPKTCKLHENCKKN